MTEILDQVKQALNLSTKAPWTHLEGIIYGSCTTAIEPMICELWRPNDKELITNAPVWLSSLITTIESLQEINVKQTEVFEKIKGESDRFMSLLNITFETHPTVEDQAKAYNSLVESQKEEIEELKRNWNMVKRNFVVLEDQYQKLKQSSLSTIPEGEK